MKNDGQSSTHARMISLFLEILTKNFLTNLAKITILLKKLLWSIIAALLNEYTVKGTTTQFNVYNISDLIQITMKLKIVLANEIIIMEWSITMQITLFIVFDNNKKNWINCEVS